MKALFLTTPTNDCDNHISAWDAISAVPSERLVFDLSKIRNDWMFAEAARKANPDVIFYIGAASGTSLPRLKTLRGLRDIAPTIHLCSDAGDYPWHKLLDEYAEAGCFDLQVGIDGVRGVPVDLVTLTPVDFRYFSRGPDPERNYRCGFSGSATGKRAKILGALGSRVVVRIRGDDYRDHVNFLRRCEMVLNVSWTGSGRAHHIKGRALEAGWAGAALLEHKDSPLKEWFPKNAFYTYETPEEAARVIAVPDRLSEKVVLLANTVREKYHPSLIYGEILEAANVRNPFTLPASQYRETA